MKFAHSLLAGAALAVALATSASAADLLKPADPIYSSPLFNFEGFYLETEDGERIFKSREHAMEQVVKGAWLERIFVTVFVEKHAPEVPVSIILRRPPNMFNVN